MAEEKAKIKKKRWIQVLSPSLFSNEIIGGIPVVEPKSLIGRTITINLMNFTRDMKKQNTSIEFVITGVQGENAVTEIKGLYLNPTSIRRLVRRGKEKVGLSIVCRTSDGKKIRIMPLAIPYGKVKGSIATKIRKNTSNYLASYIAKTTFENVVKDMITGSLQRELKGALKKVFPVRILEIAKLHTESKAVEKHVVKSLVEPEETPKKTKDKKKAGLPEKKVDSNEEIRRKSSTEESPGEESSTEETKEGFAEEILVEKPKKSSEE